MDTRNGRRPTMAIAFSILLALATLFAPTSFAAISAGGVSQAGGQDGWTQVDIWQKGISPTSPYTGDSRTATFDLYIKNSDGDYVAKEFTVDMPKGSSFSDMINAFGAQLNECIEQGYQFTWQSYGNSMTIWPTDASADPDSEGNGKSYPDEAKNRAHLRKETHPVKS